MPGQSFPGVRVLHIVLHIVLRQMAQTQELRIVFDLLPLLSTGTPTDPRSVMDANSRKVCLSCCCEIGF